LAVIKAIAMDMWDPYIAATKNFVPDAERKIVFDRFHVIRYVTDALDKVRRQEHKQLMKNGEEWLKGTKHLWLMNIILGDAPQNINIILGDAPQNIN